MEKKQNFFAKFNIKDYTNQLEKILEKKNFSLDTKNLLLSMFYKIENAYQDYEKAKQEVPTKAEFLNNLLFLIDQYCHNIIVAKFDSEASEVLEKSHVKFIINQEEKSIIAYGNELLVLNCILKIAQQEAIFPEEQQVLQYPINQILQIGNIMNQAEVIRDFNGWSWDVQVKEIEDIPRNLIYQTLLYLLGREFLQEWIENKSNIADYFTLMRERIKEQYGEKRAKAFATVFCKLAIDLAVAENKEQRNIFEELKQQKNEEYELLNNKQAYLEKMTHDKKTYTKQIEDIDKIMNNKELLKEEYTKRNEKLPNKQKIFSISHLTDKLEKERQEYLEKIKECNQSIDPVGFVNRKEKVKKEYDFYNSLHLDEESSINSNQKQDLLKLCSIFLECFQIKIAKQQNKKELMQYFYELRYYRNLVFDHEGTTLKEIPKLQNVFEKTIQLLLKKGRDLGVIDFVTEDEKANEQIINKIFDSKLIDLDHLVILSKVEKGRLFIEYYDTNILETRIELQSDRTLKLKKKTKLFL